MWQEMILILFMKSCKLALGPMVLRFNMMSVILIMITIGLKFNSLMMQMHTAPIQTILMFIAIVILMLLAQMEKKHHF